MTDRELNEALFQIVETDDVRTTDYCNDHAWCVQMMQKHRISLCPRYEIAIWDAWELCGEKIYSSDPSITRAVALAVLAIHREGK